MENPFPFPGLSILIILILILFVCFYVYFSFTFDFSEAFVAMPQPPPQIAVTLRGIAGDSAVVGPSFGTSTPAEELTLTAQSVTQLKTRFNDIDLARWELITKLPPSIFKFKVWVISDIDSPNKAKKASYFLVTIGTGVSQKIMPGTKIPLESTYSIQDITTTIPSINIKLYYDSFYNNFYNQQDTFVSQATGKLIVVPNWSTVLILLIGSWVLVVGFIELIKHSIEAATDISYLLTKIQ